MLKLIPSSLLDLGKLISGNVATKAIGILVLAFYARVLTKEEMAIFPIYAMLCGLASVIFGFGLKANLMKWLPSLLKENMPEARRLIASSGLLVISGTVVVSGFVIFFSPAVNRLLLDDAIETELIQVMAVGFVFFSVSKFVERLFLASGRFGYQSLISVMYSLVRPGCTVSLFLLFEIRGLVVGLVISQGIRAIVSSFLVRDLLLGEWCGFFSFGRLLRQSLPFYMESWIIYFRGEGDNWLVSTMLGPAALAVYFIAKTVYSTFAMAANSVDYVVTERLARNKNNPVELVKKVQTLFNVLLQLVIPLCFLAISLLPLLIPLLGGEKYFGAVTPAILLMFALMVGIMGMPLARTIFVTMPATDRVILTSVESFTLMAGLLFFTPLLGVAGVAVARWGGTVSALIASVWMLKKKMEVSFPFNNMLPVLLSAGVPAAMVLLYQPVASGIVEAAWKIPVTLAFWTGGFLLLSAILNRAVFNETLRHLRTFFLLKGTEKVDQSRSD